MENECYSIRRLADPVYDDATFLQPKANYSSTNPAYHMTAVNDEWPTVMVILSLRVQFTHHNSKRPIQ